jgi:hypothetical protein
MLLLAFLALGASAEIGNEGIRKPSLSLFSVGFFFSASTGGSIFLKQKN